MAGVAQLVERRTVIAKVTGSNPVARPMIQLHLYIHHIAITCWGVAKRSKAADFDSAMRRFESYRPNQFLRVYLCPVSSVDRASRYGREGQGFESLTGYQILSAGVSPSGLRQRILNPPFRRFESYLPNQCLRSSMDERQNPDLKVAGSIPAGGFTNKKGTLWCPF